MFSRIWAWCSAAGGLIIVALVVVYGTAQGTWTDEHLSLLVDHGRAVDVPSILPVMAAGLVGGLLVVGGLVAALTATRQHQS
jgi:uncharacterized integral membrane protein